MARRRANSGSLAVRRRITMAELKGTEPVPVDFATGCALLLRGAAIDTVGELEREIFHV